MSDTKNKKKKIGLSVIILILLILVLCFGTIISFVTDFWWFQDLGYTQVFFKKLFTELKIGIPAFIIIFALSEVYLRLLKKEYLKKLETTPGMIKKASPVPRCQIRPAQVKVPEPERTKCSR